MKMKNIQHIKDFKEETPVEPASDKSVSQLFDGPFRKIVEVRLRNSAILTKHKADVPITVYCVSGRGIFLAGSDLEDSRDLAAGTLITLESGIEHEVVSDPELVLIVSKFKAE